MNRAILEACIPLVCWLAGAFILLRLTVRLSGARLDFARLRRLHDCQQGGVQSLSFVLTMPIFIMLVLFIVQVSQLMVGVVGVHYAAFAAARAASVWIPAQLTGAPEPDYQNNHISYRPTDPRLENILPAPLSPEIPNRPEEPETPVVITYDAATQGTTVYSSDAVGSGNSQYASCEKYEKIFRAAALGCLTISPSRDLFRSSNFTAGPLSDVIYSLYTAMDPSARSNSRMSRRIGNKLAYSLMNTAVQIRFVAKHIVDGPTYNPIDHPSPPAIPWVPSEVGWNDPVTITVAHDFALLPGPGRFLAKQIVQNNGQTDLTAARISQVTMSGAEPVYTTRLIASATITSEGIKALRPYELRP